MSSFLLRVVGIKELSILLVTVAAGLYFTATSDAFNSTDNYQTIAQYVAPWSIIAAGQVMLLICGEIDLSAGFVFTLAPFLLMQFLVNGTPLFLALVLAVLISTLIGVVNGLIRTVLTIPSFITTLGMAFLLQGLVLIISNARPVAAPRDHWVVDVFGGARWSEFVWAVGGRRVHADPAVGDQVRHPHPGDRREPDRRRGVRHPDQPGEGDQLRAASARWPGSRASCRARGSAPTIRPTAAST